MDKIIIQPKNPADITSGEAEKLAKAFRTAYPGYEVQVEIVEIHPCDGYAVTWYEVISIAVVSGLAVEITKQIIKLAVDWARERFKQKQSRRPTSITIYGPKGEVLKSLVVKNATDEPEDETEKISKYEEIRKEYRKLPSKETTYQRLRRRVSKLWLRKD